MLKVFRLCYSYINSLNFTWKSAVRLDKKLGTVFLLRLALVSIRRKALLSSVGFRKRMTSRSLRGSSCESCTELCFDLLMIWCLFRGLVLLFRSSLDWFNQEDATASVWKGSFNVSPRSSLLAHQEGPFSRCYWVTSLEWPWDEWHSWRITRTSK